MAILLHKFSELMLKKLFCSMLCIGIKKLTDQQLRRDLL